MVLKKASLMIAPDWTGELRILLYFQLFLWPPAHCSLHYPLHLLSPQEVVLEDRKCRLAPARLVSVGHCK